MIFILFKADHILRSTFSEENHALPKQSFSTAHYFINAMTSSSQSSDSSARVCHGDVWNLWLRKLLTRYASQFETLKLWFNHLFECEDMSSEFWIYVYVGKAVCNFTSYLKIRIFFSSTPCSCQVNLQVHTVVQCLLLFYISMI